MSPEAKKPAEPAATKKPATPAAKATSAKPATKKKPAKKKKKRPPRGLAMVTEQGTVPWWMTGFRLVMVLALAATLPTIIGVTEGRRLFWAAAIAILPVFWVVGGYHLWRRVCPLAFFAQLGRLVGFSGQRRVSGALVQGYMLLQLGLMIAALSLRLTMTNGTRWALVGFLLAVVAVAIITGIIWTGKTWCNYICPVGMVEKIYTEPVRLGGATNSQCKPCTACKKNCPDIDLEQGYWKELDQPARRIAYYCWPGVVFGFYFYYYVVSGEWDYYFSGAWTLEDFQLERWADRGIYLFDGIPVAAAAPLTLIACAAISFAVFSLGERVALRIVGSRGAPADETQPHSELVRHRTLALAGFIAFIVFYFFGGQPTIRKLPGWFGDVFAALVVIAASAIFFRRWTRKQADFVKEKFAEKLLKRWEWGDEPPSENLADIYLVHNERTKERQNRLQAYKETVRDLVADGLVTKNELVILDSLRGQLGVSDKDHKRILGELSEEERQLFDPTYQGSIEERLQAEQYQGELRRLVVAAAHAGESPSPDALASLRSEYQVGADEETSVLAELLAPGGPLTEIYQEQVSAVAALAIAHRAALAERTESGDVGSTSYDFFRYLCQERAKERTTKALNLLTPLVDAKVPLAEITALVGVSAAAHATNAAGLREVVGADLADPLVEATAILANESAGPQQPTPEPFLALATDASSTLRATAIHLLTRFDDETAKQAVIAATSDEDALVREAAVNALGIRGRLGRKLMAAALKDPDPRVRLAAKGTVRRSGSADSTQQALEAADSAATSGVFATLDSQRRIETLTSLEKMMLLHGVPLLQTLEPGDLEELTEITADRRFKVGDTLCVEGDDADDVYLIITGKVEISTRAADGSRRTLGTSGPGKSIGEMAVLDSAPRSASVTAIEPTRALVLAGHEFKAMLGSRPSMARRIIEDLVGRLRQMIARDRDRE